MLGLIKVGCSIECRLLDLIIELHCIVDAPRQRFQVLASWHPRSPRRQSHLLILNQPLRVERLSPLLHQVNERLRLQIRLCLLTEAFQLFFGLGVRQIRISVVGLHDFLLE
jgi:hypothetical protein